MENLPLVSIIMSAYNSEAYIKEAIESVQKQTYQNWELLIVDDFSTDGTYSILVDYTNNDYRIKCFHNTENKGLTYNLVQLCHYAKGRYVARLDADDICKSDRIEKQVALMNKKDFDIVCSYAQGIGDKNSLLKVSKDGEVLRANLLFFNPIVHSTVMFVNDGSFIYDTNFKKSQDYDLWDRMSSEKKKFGVIPEALVYFRFHKNQISNKCSNEQLRNTELVRRRAISRLLFEYNDFEVNILMNWLSRKTISSTEEYFSVKKGLESILLQNKSLGLYKDISLQKAINGLKMELVVGSTFEGSTRISLTEKIKVIISALSVQSIKVLIACLLEKR